VIYEGDPCEWEKRKYIYNEKEKMSCMVIDEERLTRLKQMVKTRKKTQPASMFFFVTFFFVYRGKLVRFCDFFLFGNIFTFPSKRVFVVLIFLFPFLVLRFK